MPHISFWFIDLAPSKDPLAAILIARILYCSTQNETRAYCLQNRA